MAHDRIAVLVTYVGGPLHGQRHHLDSAPQQLWRELPDGAALLYACRMQSGEHAVYAPVGMAEHVFLDLLPTVERNTA